MTTATGHARPLAGRRVLVTRPRTQAADLVRDLEAAGAQVVIAPTIRVAPPEDRGPLMRAAADPSQFDWIVFASVNAVNAFFDAMDEAGTAPATGPPGSVPRHRLPKVCAVGSRTAERLRERGAEVAVVPAEFRAEALVDALTADTALTHARVLLPRSDIGRQVISEGLRGAGALVTEVVAYRTVAEAPGGDALDVPRLLRDRAIDAVTFTSGSAVRNFVQIHGSECTELLRQTVVAAIGPVTSQAARELGIDVHVQPTTYTIPALVDALAAYFARA